MQVKLIGGPADGKVVIVEPMDDQVMVPMIGPNGMEFNFYRRQPEGFVFDRSAPDEVKSPVP
jgi:hypothetical protein